MRYVVTSDRLDWPRGSVLDTEHEITDVNWEALLLGGHIVEYDDNELDHGDDD